MTEERIAEIVHVCYWRDDENCAVTMLRALCESFHLEPHPQLLAAATGMNGAGKYGAQCGLVEGGLLFLGVLGGERGWSSQRTQTLCQNFAREFKAHFGAMSCRILRPQGFHPEQPPHLCEALTVRGAQWSADWMENREAKGWT